MRYRSDTGAAWRQLGLLEELDWRDHFFITTELTGRPWFLGREQIRDLHQSGIVIGSHSAPTPSHGAVQPRETARFSSGPRSWWPPGLRRSHSRRV
jgi:hypothetical protein